MAHGRNSSITSIRINDQLLADVKSLAASQGLSTNQLIVQLVQHGLECRERQEFLVKSAAVSFPVTDAVSLRCCLSSCCGDRCQADGASDPCEPVASNSIRGG